MKKLITLLLVLTGCVGTASADRWVGKSAIEFNGTWYYCGEDLGDLTDDPFNNHIFGSITYLTLGGQSEVYDEGNNWASGTMTMYYKFDNDDNTMKSLTLTKFAFNSNNNVLRSGGSTYSPEYIDISDLSSGSHSIQVWFKSESTYDSNNGNNYSATFTIPSTLNVSAGSYGIATYSSSFDLDFSNVTNIDAFVITGINGDGTLITQEVSKNGETAGKKVSANTGLLIKGAANANADVPRAATTDAISTNWLKHGEGVKVDQTVTSVGTNYVLTANAGGTTKDVKFYKVNGISGNVVPIGKAYLQIPVAQSAPEFFNFDFDNNSETTDISATLKDNEEVINNKVFNLAGQRVMNPTKGLYIINGKKAVLK